jgi:hypothetical protein
VNEPANSAVLTPVNSSPKQYGEIWIWSFLMAIVVVLFRIPGFTLSGGQASALSLPGILHPRMAFWYFAGASLVAMHAALLVSVLYLLRFLRYHLLPPLLVSNPGPMAASSETPPVGYTLTGTPVVESGEEQATPDSDGVRLLSCAFIAITVALAVEVAVGACAFLIGFAS